MSRPVKTFNLRIVLLSLGLLLLLTACGKNQDPLCISLALPEGENAEDFFAGLDRRELTVAHRGSSTVIPWQSGATASVDASQGDELRFAAYDPDGTVRAEGHAPVGREKTISIPVSAVL